MMLLFIMVHVKQFKYGAYYAARNPPSAISIAPRSRSSISRCGSPSTSSAPPWLRCTCATASPSGFQSIGFDHPLYTRRLVTWGIIGAIVVGGGLAVIPLLVYLTT